LQLYLLQRSTSSFLLALFERSGAGLVEPPDKVGTHEVARRGGVLVAVEARARLAARGLEDAVAARVVVDVVGEVVDEPVDDEPEVVAPVVARDLGRGQRT
jgi:hypothetical protein